MRSIFIKILFKTLYLLIRITFIRPLDRLNTLKINKIKYHFIAYIFSLNIFFFSTAK